MDRGLVARFIRRQLSLPSQTFLLPSTAGLLLVRFLLPENFVLTRHSAQTCDWLKQAGLKSWLAVSCASFALGFSKYGCPRFRARFRTWVSTISHGCPRFRTISRRFRGCPRFRAPRFRVWVSTISWGVHDFAISHATISCDDFVGVHDFARFRHDFARPRFRVHVANHCISLCCARV
jgi:hypothetical protein